jgi:hypothetical protein
MTTVAQHYGLVGELPFLNVHLERDNRLFLDPSAIRNSSTVEAAAARQRLTGYFGEVVRCATSLDPADHFVGEALLQQLHEPNETRLGMSAGKVAGRGLGEGLSELLWEELRVNPACREAALRHLEDLPVFIKGVGPDLVSDLTTRVVFDVLVDFTQRMTIAYPSLAEDQTKVSGLVWDITSGWTPQVFELPQVEGHPLLLVPKGWVFWRSVMDPEAFYNRHATRTVQEERTTLTADGRVDKPSKKALNAEFPDIKGLNNQQAVRYIRDGIDLVQRYRTEVDTEFQPLSDTELDTRM